MIIAMSGCYDLLHIGHEEILSKAVSLAGDVGMVVVALNSDESIKRIKGEGRPVDQIGTRIHHVSNVLFHSSKSVFKDVKKDIQFVLTWFDTEDELLRIYERYQPDIIIHGDDITNTTKITGFGKWPVLLIPRVPNISTTKLIEEECLS